MDLVGPINPPSVSGFKYFLTVVDQFSSFKFIQFLKAKSEAFVEFQKLASMVENIQGVQIKEIVLDGGGGLSITPSKNSPVKKGLFTLSRLLKLLNITVLLNARTE
jgi:hypothetical protein